MPGPTPQLSLARKATNGLHDAWLAIFNSSSIALYSVDRDGIIAYWNPGACAVFGCSEQDMLNRNWLELASAESISVLNKTLAKVLRGRSVPEEVVSFKRKDGSLFFGRFSVHPIHSPEDDGTIEGAIVLTTDSSELMAADLKLKDRANQIKAIVETVVDAIITIDNQGIIEAVNPAVERIFGYKAHELIGLNVSALMPSPYREEHDGYLRRFQSTREPRVIGIGREVSGQRKNGEVFPMDLAVNAVTIDGHESYVGVVKDISERKHHEAELQRQYERTEQLNTELQSTLEELSRTQHELVEAEKLAALGSVVAGLAHEINTPLGVSMTAASHLEALFRQHTAELQGSKLTQSGLEHFFSGGAESTALLQRNLQRAAELVNTFKRLSVSTSSDNICSLTDDRSLENILLSLTAELKKHQCELRINNRLEHPINLDASVLRDVLHNIVLNAAIHGYQGQGGVVYIDISSRPHKVTFAVRDEGVGMSEEVADKIFEPFFTTRRNKGGLGLGLHLTYNLVKQTLHGSINVKTTPGQGTCFVLDIPSVNQPNRSPAP
jgi:PAS domain S-box-containing protein